MVRIPFLKRLIVPFTTVSSASLMFTFQSAKAATIGDVVFQKRGVLTHNFGGDSNGFSLLEMPKQAIHNIDIFTGYIMKGIDWLNNLPLSIPKMTADLLTYIFHFLSKIVLQTPLFIFNNPYIKNTSLTFALISITLVTIFTVFEAFMQMINKKHTDFHTIAKRWLIVASVSGFVPFAFETGFGFLNKLTDAITSMGLNGGNSHGLISEEKMGWFDTLVIILFDLTAISMLIPICLQAGRRWWDLLCLCAISPLALSAFCFDRHKHYFDKWLESVKTHSLSQLVYAVYILLMGIMIFSTQSIQGGFITLAIKIVLVLAGLNKMTHPPQFIKRMTDNGSDVFDEYDKTKGTLKDVYDTLTFRNFRPVQFLRDRKEKKLAQANKLSSLRKKHGKRYVSDLL
jgi:hypothetical protein